PRQLLQKLLETLEGGRHRDAEVGLRIADCGLRIAESAELSAARTCHATIKGSAVFGIQYIRHWGAGRTHSQPTCAVFNPQSASRSPQSAITAVPASETPT